jgi:hypothetical protein
MRVDQVALVGTGNVSSCHASNAGKICIRLLPILYLERFSYT